jgi:hypothetical protein
VNSCETGGGGGVGVSRLVTPASHHMIEGCERKDSREQLIKTSRKAWRGCARLGGEWGGDCEEEKICCSVLHKDTDVEFLLGFDNASHC